MNAVIEPLVETMASKLTGTSLAALPAEVRADIEATVERPGSSDALLAVAHILRKYQLREEERRDYATPTMSDFARDPSGFGWLCE